MRKIFTRSVFDIHKNGKNIEERVCIRYSLTCWLCVKAAQTNSKRLECRQWVPVIHSKDIFSYFSKLKYDRILLW